MQTNVNRELIELIPTLHPYCFPIGFKVDNTQLLLDCYKLVTRLGLDYQHFINSGKMSQSINITHMPNLIGKDRWDLGKGTHPDVLELGMQEIEYTEHLQETQDLYLGHLVHDIYKLHKQNYGTEFQGRVQLVWLHPKQKFKLHIDTHTPHRYHIPIITNEKCYWLFRNIQSTGPVMYKLHMPVGDVWYVNPVTITHTFVNDSSTHRLHLLLTSGL